MHTDIHTHNAYILNITTYMYTKENYTHTRSCISEEDRGNTQVQSHLQRERERERERERKRERERERKRERERERKKEGGLWRLLKAPLETKRTISSNKKTEELNQTDCKKGEARQRLNLQREERGLTEMCGSYCESTVLSQRDTGGAQIQSNLEGDAGGAGTCRSYCRDKENKMSTEGASLIGAGALEPLSRTEAGRRCWYS